MDSWQFSDTDWRPKILFEAHWFHKFTNGIYDKSHPNISSSVWNKELYYYGKKNIIDLMKPVHSIEKLD
jgi:hypothetical protein